MKNNDIKSVSSKTLLGVVFMAIAACLFPVKDALIKALSGSVNAIEAAIVYFLVQAIMGIIWLRLSNYNDGVRYSINTISIRMLLIRSMLLVVSIVSFFYAIQFAPLAESVVLFAMNPIFVVVFSATVLKETLTRKVFISVPIGFFGVLLIIRPSINSIPEYHLLFALLSSISFSLYLITTRIIGKQSSPMYMFVFDGVFGSLCAISILLVLHFSELRLLRSTFLTIEEIFFLVMSGMIGAVSALLVIFSLRQAPASVIAPAGYLEIVSASIIGYLIFKEPISTLSVLGALAIIFASWYSSKSDVCH